MNHQVENDGPLSDAANEGLTSEVDEDLRRLYARRREARDAARYRHLRELSVVQAQAFFWTYTSRSQRDKAIDVAIGASGSLTDAQDK